MRKTAVLQSKTTVLNGGLDGNRTSDTRIFNPLNDHKSSYFSKFKNVIAKWCATNATQRRNKKVSTVRKSIFAIPAIPVPLGL
jgi:hypothetical protein